MSLSVRLYLANKKAEGVRLTNFSLRRCGNVVQIIVFLRNSNRFFSTKSYSGLGVRMFQPVG